MEDHCVICGEIIPEGSWICGSCAKIEIVSKVLKYCKKDKEQEKSKNE